MYFLKRCCFTRVKQVAIILVFFCVVYYIKTETDLYAVLEEIGPACVIPQIDLFTVPFVKRRKHIPNIECGGEDWVRCYLSKCKVVDNRLKLMSDITCTYSDLIHISDKEYTFGPPTDVKNDAVYTLDQSDHVKVNCVGRYKEGNTWDWQYYAAGFRESVKRKRPPRKDALNVLLLMFDSTSRTDFLQYLPKTYEYLIKSLNGVVLKGYNIVGDGTIAAILPILTGHSEYEFPNMKKNSTNRTCDSLPLMFYSLRDAGYRTAFLEDMPWIGTFQYKFNGFLHQPTDHYLRSFFREELKTRLYLQNMERFCVGDTPQYQYMLKLTDQFLLLDGKRFCLTIIADLTHGVENSLLPIADNSVLNFMQNLTKRQQFEDTLVLVMGDHGPRYGKRRATIQGRLDERLPFVCVILPEQLKRRRPEAQAVLEMNANRWTTPFDVHTTILDALEMPQYMNQYQVPGANMPRGMSFLKPIPETRSCWHAGIPIHWCSCVAWRPLEKINPFYHKVGNMIMRYINLLTAPIRDKCEIRYMIAIDWVKQQLLNKNVLARTRKTLKIRKEHFQGRVVLGPGRAIFEATMTYIYKSNRFLLDTRDISRVDAYGNESICISNYRPTLNKYCYCKF